MEVPKQSQIDISSAGGFEHISSMRIVLLGQSRAGKSSSGNTILGREEFDTSQRTAECVKREGETAGRHITVVEAPRWWTYYTIGESPERVKEQIVHSVSLCPPGPHALLLVIRVGTPVKEANRRALQEHLELLGEGVWSHSIVLFTGGDRLGDTSIEQHIQSGGQALQWVVEKCGNRYHVLDNTERDVGQVTELLEKIEEMVAGNSGLHFDANVKQLMKEKERKAEENVVTEQLEMTEETAVERGHHFDGNENNIDDEKRDNDQVLELLEQTESASGNGSHHSDARPNDDHVLKMVEKIEDMVEGKTGLPVDIDENKLKKQMEEKQEVERRAVVRYVVTEGLETMRDENIEAESGHHNGENDTVLKKEDENREEESVVMELLENTDEAAENSGHHSDMDDKQLKKQQEEKEEEERTEDRMVTERLETTDESEVERGHHFDENENNAHDEKSDSGQERTGSGSGNSGHHSDARAEDDQVLEILEKTGSASGKEKRAEESVVTEPFETTGEIEAESGHDIGENDPVLKKEDSREEESLVTELSEKIKETAEERGHQFDKNENNAPDEKSDSGQERTGSASANSGHHSDARTEDDQVLEMLEKTGSASGKEKRTEESVVTEPFETTGEIEAESGHDIGENDPVLKKEDSREEESLVTELSEKIKETAEERGHQFDQNENNAPDEKSDSGQERTGSASANSGHHSDARTEDDQVLEMLEKTGSASGKEKRTEESVVTEKLEMPDKIEAESRHHIGENDPVLKKEESREEESVVTVLLEKTEETAEERGNHFYGSQNNVLNEMRDSGQVTELLEKTEPASGNGSHHSHINEKKLHKQQEEKEEEERTEDRMVTERLETTDESAVERGHHFDENENNAHDEKSDSGQERTASANSDHHSDARTEDDQVLEMLEKTGSASGKEKRAEESVVTEKLEMPDKIQAESRHHIGENDPVLKKEESREEESVVTELLERTESAAGKSGHHFDDNENDVDDEKKDDGHMSELLEKSEEMVKGKSDSPQMPPRKQASKIKPPESGVAHISNMRIVLLGNRHAGRSSSGNTILGRKEFEIPGRTTECVKREGETAGRHITVVEAPGWWENSTIKDTPVRDKQEIVLSVSLCPPGPHALLLVIRVDVPFTGKCRKAMQEHMELLGQRVWSHTVVLFTRGDHLGDTSIEQHIESGGEALQWVVEKCGNRYHVVDNKKSDGDQIVELLVKVEEMVAGNGGSLYETPRKQANSYNIIPPQMSDSGFISEDSKTESSSSAARCTQSQTDLAKARESGFDSQDFKTLSSSSPAEYSQSQGDFPKDFISKIPFVSKDAIQIMKYIDGGSFGSVYQGSFQGTPVAVKKMPFGKCPSQSLELVIPLRLFHPNIVKMMAVSRKENDILIAYEYIHGASLEQVIHAQNPIKLNEEDKMCLALEIGMAVQYIHEKNIIHQDIKPANILVSERSKTAYLTDWGLANMKDSLAQFGVAASASMCGPRSAGSPLYMPPELLVQNERCTTMSDMWSLGLTYLEMFTGSVPWNLNNPYALPGLLLKQEPPHALAKLQPHLTEIVKPLVQYEPQSRMTATDLVTCLKSKIDLEKRYGFEF